MNTDPPPETRVPSAATHECPGGCGTELDNKLFACTKCFRQLPHRMRQNIIRTRPRKYLDAERLQAIHDAEDYLEGLRDPDFKPPAAKTDAVSKATTAALEKAELSDQLGQACAVNYAQRKDMVPNLPNLQQRHRGKR